MVAPVSLVIAGLAIVNVLLACLAWRGLQIAKAMHRDVLHAAIDLHQVLVEQLAHQKALLLQGARPDPVSGAADETPEQWLTRLGKGRTR